MIFRLSGDDFFPGGLTQPEARQVAIWAAETGADAIHVAGGHYRSLPSGAVMIPPMSMPDATFLHFAAEIRRHVSVPVIAVGRLGNPDAAIAAVRDGSADFVALGRPLLADPEWVKKTLAGESVRMCIACNTCVDGMRSGERLHCLVNPVTGRESQFSDRHRPVGLKIAVVGAGPAGLSYASLTAAQNTVTIFERASVAGGAFRLAGRAPKFQSVEAHPMPLLRYIDTLERRCRAAGARFVFDCKIECEIDRLREFDLVVNATGARYRAGLGFIPALLRAGLVRLPGLRRLASNDRWRDWFYYKARVSTADTLQRQLAGQRVIEIGDAAKPGKSVAAIRSAFEAAFGLGAA